MCQVLQLTSKQDVGMGYVSLIPYALFESFSHRHPFTMFLVSCVLCVLNSLSHYLLAEIYCSCEDAVASWTYMPI